MPFPRLLAPVLLCLFATAAQAQDDLPTVPSEPNTVCGPKVSAGRFSVKDVAPGIVGTWFGTAPGLGLTKGSPLITFEVTFENGRLYMSGEGRKTELKPVQGVRKALRYDPVHQKALPYDDWAVKVESDALALVYNCEEGMAPQFTWNVGVGARSAGGVYSFFGPNAGLGTMWNSASGAREVFLER